MDLRPPRSDRWPVINRLSDKFRLIWYSYPESTMQELVHALVSELDHYVDDTDLERAMDRVLQNGFKEG